MHKLRAKANKTKAWFRSLSYHTAMQ